MRQLLALVLLMVLGLPSALPLFAATQREDAGLPACCRKHGRHHCAMTHAASFQLPVSNSVGEMRPAGEVCPMRYAMPARVHVDPVTAAPPSLWIYADVVSHPAVQAQVESRWRVARERARGKRGPPNTHAAS